MKIPSWFVLVVILCIAVAGAFATFALASISYWVNGGPGLAGLFRQDASDMRAALSVTPLSVEQDQPGPTATPTIVAAPTLLSAPATATAKAAQALLRSSADWPLVISDPFNDNKNGWEVSDYYGNTFKATESIAQGKYLWSVEANSSPALDWELPEMKGVSDFAASVEAMQTAGTPTGRYGLIFRWSSGQRFYLFDVAEDGTYRLSLATKENPGKTLASGRSEAIRAGAVNRLTVIGNGPDLTFFVNDQLVVQVMDPSLPKGEVGVAVELGNRGNQVTVEFDNFEVRAR